MRRQGRQTTSFPGVQRVGRGEYRIRGKYIHPKTLRRAELDRVIEASTSREAAHKRAAELRKAALGSGPEPQRMAEYVRSWIAGKLPILKPSTRVAYATALDLHILPHFGEWFIDRMTRADIAEWRDSMALTAEAHTVNGRLRVLRNVLEDAAQDLRLVRSPADGVAVLPTKKKSKSLSPAELARLLEAVRSKYPKWYPLVLTLAHTGARFGEASALEWRDIDWEAESIRIERAHVRGKVGTTKTEDPRVVPLTPELAEVLKRHRVKSGGFALVFPARLRAGATAAEAGNLGYSQPSCLTKPLRGARALAKLDREVSPHWFRHTWNNLLRQTADKETQQAIVGHSTEEMSAHYSHVSLGEKRAAVARVLALVGRKGGDDGGDR
jgi:integrase